MLKRWADRMLRCEQEAAEVKRSSPSHRVEPGGALPACGYPGERSACGQGSSSPSGHPAHREIEDFYLWEISLFFIFFSQMALEDTEGDEEPSSTIHNADCLT